MECYPHDYISIDSLPDEIICIIIRCIDDAITLQRLLSTSRRWRQLTKLCARIIRDRTLRKIRLQSDSHLILVMPIQLILNLRNLQWTNAYIDIKSGDELIVIANLLPKLQTARFRCYDWHDDETLAPAIIMFIHQYCHGNYIDRETGDIRQFNRDFIGRKTSFSFSVNELSLQRIPNDVLDHPITSQSIFTVHFVMGFLTIRFSDQTDQDYIIPRELFYRRGLYIYQAILERLYCQFNTDNGRSIVKLPITGITIPTTVHQALQYWINRWAPSIQEIRIIQPPYRSECGIPMQRFTKLARIVEDMNYSRQGQSEMQDSCRRILESIDPTTPLHEILIPIIISDAKGLLEHLPHVTKIMIDIGWHMSPTSGGDVISLVQELLDLHPKLKLIIYKYTPGHLKEDWSKLNFPPHIPMFLGNLLELSPRVSLYDSRYLPPLIVPGKRFNHL